MRRLTLCATLIGAALLACTPTLDWREVRPEGSGLTVLFPCQPKSQTRTALVAGVRLPMTLVSCGAGSATYAVGHLDLGEQSHVAAALTGLRSALAGNLGAVEVRSQALVKAGATPNPQSVRVWWAGRLPDGTPVQEQAALFARGSRAFQAVVLAPQMDEAAAEIFFESLRLPP